MALAQGVTTKNLEGFTIKATLGNLFQPNPRFNPLALNRDMFNDPSYFIAASLRIMSRLNEEINIAVEKCRDITYFGSHLANSFILYKFSLYNAPVHVVENEILPVVLEENDPRIELIGLPHQPNYYDGEGELVFLIPRLDQHFFYHCFRTVCGHRFANYTDDQIQEDVDQERFGQSNQKIMSNEITQFYNDHFLALLQVTGSLNILQDENQNPICNNYTQILNMMARDLTQSLGAHVAANYEAIRIKTFKLDIEQRQSDLNNLVNYSSDTCAKLAKHLFKRLTGQDTFFPTSLMNHVDRDAKEAFINQLFQEYNQDNHPQHNGAGHMQIHPGIYIPFIIQSLEIMEQQLLNRQMTRPLLPQKRAKPGYLKRKLAKLPCYELLSTRKRRKLLHSMFYLIDAAIDEVNGIGGFGHFEDFDQVFEFIRQHMVELINDEYRSYLNTLHDEQMFFYIIAKIAFKIMVREFRPKEFSTARGTRLFKILPLYSYQRRFIPVDSHGLQDIQIAMQNRFQDWTPDEMQVLLSNSWRGRTMVPSHWAWKFMDTGYLKINTLEKFQSKNYNGTFYSDGYSVCLIFTRVKQNTEMDFILPYSNEGRSFLDSF